MVLVPNKDYGSIPEPQLSVESLRDSVVALKQAVEVLIGHRGDIASNAVTQADLISLGIINTDGTSIRDNGGLLASASSLFGSVTAAQAATLLALLGVTSTTAANIRTALGLVIGTDIQALLTLASNAEAIAGVENTHYMTPLRTAAAIAALTTAPAFTLSYISSQQTITAGGSLTLAHSLGVIPKLMQFRLVNTTAEFGYSLGDEALIHYSGGSVANTGMAVVPDATNLNIRFGSTAATFDILSKNSGNTTAVTNANWKLVARAWA